MSPDWYDDSLFKRQIGREIAYAEDKGLRPPTVREFVAQFHSLSSTAKGRDVLAALSAQGTSLRELFDDDARIATLLRVMQGMSAPINPRRLGIVGPDHLKAWAVKMKAISGSFEYRMKAFEHLGLPYVAEVAFAHAPERRFRLDVTGLNFSPVIGGRPLQPERGRSFPTLRRWPRHTSPSSARMPPGQWPSAGFSVAPAARSRCPPISKPSCAPISPRIRPRRRTPPCAG
jgi:hypothetical protein